MVMQGGGEESERGWGFGVEVVKGGVAVCVSVRCFHKPGLSET